MIVICKFFCFITKPVMASETYYVDVCDGGEDKYRFGFNGQEKVNEISGVGNHNTAEFWEYDTRLGRRWNLDPVDQISISNYVAFRNNPIVFIDVEGNVVRVGEQYRNQLFEILKETFGEDLAIQFSYTPEGNLIFNGRVKDFSKQERKVYNHLQVLMDREEITNVVFEVEYEVNFIKDGKEEKQIINTGPNGTKGDAAVYADNTANGESYLIVNPNTVTHSTLIDYESFMVMYDKDGNETKVIKNSVKTEYKYLPIESRSQDYTPYENFWHGVGHLKGGKDKDYKAMDVENDAGKVHKPKAIPHKKYNSDHLPPSK